MITIMVRFRITRSMFCDMAINMDYDVSTCCRTGWGLQFDVETKCIDDLMVRKEKDKTKYKISSFSDFEGKSGFNSFWKLDEWPIPTFLQNILIFQTMECSFLICESIHCNLMLAQSVESVCNWVLIFLPMGCQFVKCSCLGQHNNGLMREDSIQEE